MPRFKFIHAAGLSSQTIHDLYLRMMHECRDRKYYYGKQCASPYEFVQYARSKYTWMFVAYHEGDTACTDVLGFSACDRHTGNAMRVHVCLFKSGLKYSLEIGMDALNWMRDNLMGVNVLIGEIPTSNTLAIAYMKRLGFNVIGVVPEAVDTRNGVDGMAVGYYRLRDGK